MPSHPLDHHTGRISLILLVEAIQGRSECGSPEKRNASKKRTCRHGEDPRQDVRSHRGEAVPGGRIHNSNRAILSHSSLYPRDKAIKSIRRAKGGGGGGRPQRWVSASDHKDTWEPDSARTGNHRTGFKKQQEASGDVRSYRWKYEKSGEDGQ